jgi:hypothetical protein
MRQLRRGVAAYAPFLRARVCGALAGNGGKMAVLQKALKTDNTKAKTRRTTKSKGGKRARRENPSHKDGAERLRQAADRRVGRNSEKLADLLTEKALGGDLASAKTLVALAAAKKPIPEPVKKRHEPSYADKLAKEPQWPKEAEVEGMEGWDGRPF